MKITPLILAVINNKKDLLLRLLESGEDPLIEQPWIVARKLGFDEIANLLPVAFDQDFLLDILKPLNYKIDDKGLCFGFAHMAKHYIHTRQTEVLNDQLFKLLNLYLALRKNTLEELDLKQHDVNMKFQQKFSQAMVIAIDAFQKSSAANEKQFYYNFMALFDGIYLYQYHDTIYPHWKFCFSTAAAQDTLNIVMDDENKLEYRGQFSGVYALEQIKEYLQLISSNLEMSGFSQPVSLILTTNRHAYTIGYDPLIHSWIYADAANMPLTLIADTDVLAKKMIASFSSNKVTIFTSAFYAATEDREKMTSFMTRLREHPAWQKIHETTLEKTQVKAGKQHKYHWERIATGNDLKHIQEIKLAHTNPLVKQFSLIPTKIVNKFTLFVTNKTYGKYPTEIDRDPPVPIYQDIDQKPR